MINEKTCSTKIDSARIDLISSNKRSSFRLDQKKNTIVSINVGNEKNVHSGGRKFFFLT